MPLIFCGNYCLCDYRKAQTCKVLNVPFCSDGAAVWADKPGQHLLHERHRAMSALCSRAQNCPEKVRPSPSNAAHVGLLGLIRLCVSGIRVLCDLQEQTRRRSTSQQVGGAFSQLTSLHQMFVCVKHRFLLFSH